MFGWISKAEQQEKSAAVDAAIDRQAAARAQRKRDDAAADRLSREHDAPRGYVHRHDDDSRRHLRRVK